jgi:hypothetical protein
MGVKLTLFWLLFCAALEAQNPLTTATERYFNAIRRNLEASAEAMPAGKYGFRLTAEQMSFADWLNHSTQRNYADCAILKGESVPSGAQRATTLKEKGEVSQALKDSFAYCADALNSMDDRKAVSTPEISNALLHIIVHGNVVGYLRSSGIVPPSTAARAKQKSPR